MRLLSTAALVTVLSIGAAREGAAQTGGPTHPRNAGRHETQAQLRREARVTAAQARGTALRVVPHGRIRSSELEREGGRLIYSFDIAVPGRGGIDEVNVDALSGHVVAHQHEGPAAERAETRTETREARRKP